jgi:hypothetical protein
MRSSGILLLFALACAKPGSVRFDSSPSVTSADSVLTLFDSLAAIHRDHPDMSLFRRLHPSADTILYVEGTRIERMTGDSLFRRVAALHVPVKTMHQRFWNRSAHFLDAQHAVLTASERVDWVDQNGPHVYEGLLTIDVSRRGRGWVIRAYRGT